MKKLVLLVCACYAITCFGVKPVTLRAETPKTEPAARLSHDLEYLSSDALEGRNTGSEGIRKAGEFIAERFQQLGLKTDSFDGTPYQEFTIPGPAALGPTDRNTLTFAGAAETPTPVLGKNYTGLSLGNNGKFEGELVFAGYGITAPEFGYDDYANLDVRDKVVVILRKEPQQNQESSKFDGKRSSQYAYFSSKELNAALHNAAALIIVNDSKSAEQEGGDKLPSVSRAGRAVSKRQVPTLYCLRSLIDPLVQQATGKSLADLEKAIDDDLKPRSQVLGGISAKGEVLIKQSQIPVRNVIGFLPGTGTLADEYVVVGAHYDHVGMGGPGSLAPGTIAIHNGADDNASGTVSLLEVARRIAHNDAKNRRSIIFIAFTGEEKGLLGSKHYVKNPRWALEKTVAMVNMDMVGRLHDNTLTIYGIGTARRFDSLVERLNGSIGLTLNKKAAGFGPSDHSSFYQVHIPVFHFFTGLHNDYHRPTDDFDKANIAGMARIVDLVTGVVVDLATNPDPPELIETNAVAQIGRGPGGPPSRRRPRAILGIQLDTSVQAPTTAVVNDNSPADQAGMKAGDVIVKIGETTIKNIADLRKALGSKKPGDKVQVSVQRNEQVKTIDVKLGRG